MTKRNYVFGFTNRTGLNMDANFNINITSLRNKYL